jgi:hypothetical protein
MDEILDLDLRNAEKIKDSAAVTQLPHKRSHCPVMA